MSRVLAALLFIAALSFLGCRRAEPPDTPSILILGSRGMIPLVSEIADRFRESRPDIRIDIEPALGDRAVADTRAGLADVGLLGRSLRPEETGLRGQVLARDGVAFVVNRANNVPAPLEPHLVGVLTRVYTNWKDAGGSDRPIVLVGPGEGRAVRDVLIDYFGLRQPQLRPDPALGSSRLVLDAVATQPAVIGYVSVAAVETFANKQELRLLPFHGVAPTVENVRNRTYPIVRNLVLLTREPTHPNAKAFVEFALSETCYDLITKHGFASPAP
jgi:phosphate transport system substrate-binding protein